MAEITTALVKELRERTGAGMMDCKRALARGRGRHRGGDRLAAQEGSGGGRQEGQPGHQRGPDRHGAGRHRRGAGRGQRRDRLRRPQRDLPGAGAPDRGAGARGQGRSRGAEGGADRGDRPDGRRRDHAGDRGDRREHQPAPDRLSRGAGRVRSPATCTTSSSPGLGKLGVLVALESTGDAARAGRDSASSWRCTSRPPTRRRSAPTSSTRP